MRTEVVDDWFLDEWDNESPCLEAEAAGVNNVEVCLDGVDLLIEHEAAPNGSVSVYIPVKALEALLAAHHRWLSREGARKYEKP